MFDDIAVYRCRDSFVDFGNDGKQQVATEYLWASLQAHRVMADEFRHHPSIAPISNYHLYCNRLPWSVFNDLREEVSEAGQVADEAKRRVDRLTTASCGGSLEGGGASEEEESGSKVWSEPRYQTLSQLGQDDSEEGGEVQSLFLVEAAPGEASSR
jgi:hypothetical protein